MEAVIAPDATKQCIMYTEGDCRWEEKVDDGIPRASRSLRRGWNCAGTVFSGKAALCRVAGVLSSAVSMDKLYTKIIVDDLGIRQAAYVPVMVWKMRQDMDRVIRQVRDRFAYPVFIKPSNAGSSRGEFLRRKTGNS